MAMKRGNSYNIYYDDAQIKISSDDLSTESEPKMQIVKYCDDTPKLKRALPYSHTILEESMQKYGPLVRYPIMDLEMVRMLKCGVDAKEPNTPPLDSVWEFIVPSYPKDLQKGMRAAISCVQKTIVSVDTFHNVVEPLAMTIATMFQEPRIREVMERSDADLVKRLLPSVQNQPKPNDTNPERIERDSIVNVPALTEEFELIHVNTVKEESVEKGV